MITAAPPRLGGVSVVDAAPRGRRATEREPERIQPPGGTQFASLSQIPPGQARPTHTRQLDLSEYQYELQY